MSSTQDTCNVVIWIYVDPNISYEESVNNAMHQWFEYNNEYGFEMKDSSSSPVQEQIKLMLDMNVNTFKHRHDTIESILSLPCMNGTIRIKFILENLKTRSFEEELCELLEDETAPVERASIFTKLAESYGTRLNNEEKAHLFAKHVIHPSQNGMETTQ